MDIVLLFLRLLWEIGGNLAFYPPKYRIIDDSTREFLTRSTISSLAHNPDWASVLRSWTCPSNLTFYECAAILAKNVSALKTCNLHLDEIISDWINDLQDVGYKEPQRVAAIHFQQNNIPDSTTSAVVSRVIFTTQPVLTESEKHNPSANWDQLRDVALFCDKFSFNVKSDKLRKTMFHDILLLIVFNFPHYNNIPYLELTYATTFSHIAYCGTNRPAFLASSSTFKRNVTFIEIDDVGGIYNYRCMSLAMKMNYNVKGYLFLGDDVLLNSAVIEGISLDKIWMVPFGPLRRSQIKSTWGNWMQSFGRPVFLSAWEELEYLSRSSAIFSNSFMKFKKNLIANTGFDDGLRFSSVDVYYIPSHFKDDIIFYFDHFSRHKVFLEIAAPTILSGLVLDKDFVFIPGTYLWTDEERQNYKSFFKRDHVFLHPVKFGPEFKSEKGIHFFCQTYYPLILFGK